MAEMKTFTICGITFEVVDGHVRTTMDSAIGILDDLITDDKTNLVAAINEACTRGGGSGGGGSSNNAVLTLQNTTGWLYKNIAQTNKCVLQFDWSSLEDGVSTGTGAVTVKVGGVSRYSASINQGANSVDITNYLSSGSNVVRLSVSDIYGNSRTLAFTINVIALSVASSFDATITHTGPINFSYTPVGAIEKTVHFILDGVEIGTYVTSESGRQQTYVIPEQTHGSHTLSVYCEGTIDGETVSSNVLYYDIICLEEGVDTPIISSTFRETEAEQYASFTVPYSVYDPLSLTTSVELLVDGDVTSTQTVDRTVQTWAYRPDIAGELTLTIRCTGTNGDVVTKSFTLTVAETQINVNATTNDMGLYLSSYGRSNNEELPGVWTYGDIAAQFENFNFKTDGWLLDDEGVTVLRVSGDARLTIPYQIFASDFRSTGKTIEIEFATRDVLNYDAVLLSCMSGGRGLEVTAQKATLTSEQSVIGTQYKEEEHVRLSFVVDKRTDTKLLLCYINGILSGTVQYPDEDDFSQTSPVGISIGTSDCTTDIYCIRVYDNNLTRYQLLDNWIADTQIGSLRKDRYDRNNIYDEYGQITVDTVKKDLPYLVVSCPILPQFKGDKKTCSGYYVDPVNPTKSFEFESAEIDVQGTSSQYYYVKNFKIKFKGGFTMSDSSSAEVYQLHDDSVPTDTYTFKADVASSEGANNVVLAQIYNDLCPVQTPPQVEDPKVRQTIDGHPIVIFWDGGSGLQFIGKYNFNHDKGTEEVFGFADGDESWEILQNGTERTGFRSADFSGTDWKNDFEARYPEDNVDTTNLAAFAAWLVSTNSNAATDADLDTAVTYGDVEYTTDSAEYRLAKFKAELADYANVDAMVFYYVITELFLCIDQREKNAFPTMWAADPRWMMLFYDADSSLGIDNKGNLAFDYYLEDIDYTEAGDPVYNGQASVLWINLRECFYDEIAAEYRRLRTTARVDGSGRPLLSYDVVNDLFETHQSKWSEAIYNEDGYRKSIEPYVLNGDTLYLPMLQGKKEQQRKWWLYNRFRYLDSKYNTGSSMETRITLRAHAQADIELVSYVNMYGHVYYNAEMAEHRMYRGQTYAFEWAASGAEDAVIGINDADMLTSLGDLSPLMVELIDISKATHLTSLKIGDASDSYTNGNLNSITLGNNVLLKTMDFRNCVSLSQAVDASGCTGLEEAYFDGTAITGLSLPNGGNVRVLHLPETITNLTIRNQMKLTDFTIPSYANITTLRLENVSSVVDPLAILDEIPANSRVRIIGFDKTVDTVDDIFDFYDQLDTMRGLDENGNNVDKPQMSGTIRVDSLTGAELAQMKSRYPTINIVYNSITSYLYFYNEDGTQLLYTCSCEDGANGMYVGSEPTKTSTAQYEYDFAGWSLTPGGSVDDEALASVTTDRNVYAVFTATVRTYTVRFYNGSTLLQTVSNVPYGGSATYTGSTPEKGEEDYEFIGFNPDGTSITGDTDCYAQYKYTGLVSVKLVQRTLSGGYENDRVESIGNYAFYTCYSLTTVSFPAATTIGRSAFAYCSSLTTVSFPVATTIGYSAFEYCRSLTTVSFPAATSIGNYAFASCSSLSTVSFPVATTIDYGAFSGCYSLTTVSFPAVTSIGSYAFAYCTSLTTASFPAVTTIGIYAFQNCYSLTTVSFPAVTSIGSSAFYRCNSLTALVLAGSSQCALGASNAMTSTPIASGTGCIYVPSSLVTSYQAASNWSYYSAQISAIEDSEFYEGGNV